MTITINVPQEAELRLQAEALRTGLPLEKLVERVISERFETPALSLRRARMSFLDHEHPVRFQRGAQFLSLDGGVGNQYLRAGQRADRCECGFADL